MPSGIFDLRGAQSYSTVGTSRSARTGGNAEGVRPRRGLAWARRARRCEKMPLGAVHPRPQQIAGEICGLKPFLIAPPSRATYDVSGTGSTPKGPTGETP